MEQCRGNSRPGTLTARVCWGAIWLALLPLHFSGNRAINRAGDFDSDAVRKLVSQLGSDEGFRLRIAIAQSCAVVLDDPVSNVLS